MFRDTEMTSIEVESTADPWPQCKNRKKHLKYTCIICLCVTMYMYLSYCVDSTDCFSFTKVVPKKTNSTCVCVCECVCVCVCECVCVCVCERGNIPVCFYK